MLSFLCQMTYDLRRVETFTLSRKPLNFACIEIIHQVTIPVEIYFLSSLGQRCTVYVHLNSIHSVWGWKFIIWCWLLYCTLDWYQFVQFKFTALKLQNHVIMAQTTTKVVWVCKWSTANKDDKSMEWKLRWKLGI